MKRNERGGEDGWTFIETIIVIAIIMVLTSSVGIIAIQYVDKARVATAKAQIDSFSVALETYYMDCGRYPDADEGLESLWKRGESASQADGWKGPYLYRSVPADPWGTPYAYSVPGKNGLPYRIVSFGSDGKEGGDGYAADIDSNE